MPVVENSLNCLFDEEVLSEEEIEAAIEAKFNEIEGIEVEEEIRREEEEEEDYENIADYFPFPTMRGGQPEILESIKEALLNPKVKYIVAELSTGFGKSPIALAASKASGSAYIATANKFLQKQYLRDFSDHLVELKGRANYKCTQYDVPDNLIAKFGEFYNCINSPCQETKEGKQTCSSNKCCEYHKQFQRAVRADITLFNYASALAFLNYAHDFTKRNLLICDECHNIPHWITSFVSIDFSQKNLQEIGFNKKIPNFEALIDYCSFLVEIQRFIKDRMRLAKHLDSSLADKLETLRRRFSVFDEVTANKTDMENFLLEKVFENTTSVVLKLSFKPVSVEKLVQRYLFRHAKKVILFSATILDFDTYLKMMGIDNEEECVVIQAPNKFPKENRPVLTNMAVGYLNRNNITSMMPSIVTAISDILNYYPDVKGLIHGVTYTICNYIHENLKSDRILFPREAKYQYEMYQKHVDSPEPTFLLSPSMTEGVDLYDDLCRVQIYAKMPYVSLGDPIIKKRMEKYTNYYNMQTALSLVQGMGRGVRNEKDICHIYMLDKCMFSFFENNYDILPDDFEEIIDVYKRGRRKLERYKPIKRSNRQYIRI